MSVSGAVRIRRTNIPGSAFINLAPGQIGINQHDDMLFWPGPDGVTRSARLADIATAMAAVSALESAIAPFGSIQSFFDSIATFQMETNQALSALQGFTQVTAVHLVNSTQNITFDARSQLCLMALYAGSGAEATIAGENGGAGGNTSFLSVQANGGTGNHMSSGEGDPFIPGVDGSGSGGLVIVGGGPSGPPNAGSGGLVIGYLAITGGETHACTIGAGGTVVDGLPGHGGGALILELK